MVITIDNQMLKFSEIACKANNSRGTAIDIMFSAETMSCTYF